MRRAFTGVSSIRAMPLTPVPTRSYWPIPKNIKQALRPKADMRWINPFHLAERGTSENKSTQAIINEMKHTGSRQVAPHKVAILMYNMMKQNVFDPFAAQVFSEVVRKFRPDDFKPMSFVGMLIAAYTTNSYPKEFVTRIQEMAILQHNFYTNPTYCHRLLIAMGKTTQFSREEVHEMISLKLKHVMLEDWDSRYASDKKILPDIAKELISLEYTDVELWDKILGSFDTYIDRYTGFRRVLSMLEVIQKLNELEGYAKKGQLTDLVAKFDKKAHSLTEANWRYNFDERRYKNWEEMLSQRDMYKESDFMIGQFSKGFAKDVIKKEQAKTKEEVREYGLEFFESLKVSQKDRYNKDAKFKKYLDDLISSFQNEAFIDDMLKK